MCVCVFFPFILDTKFVGRTTSRGHTGGRSHRIFHPPSFCGACLNFSREKDSAIPFPRRPRSRILCTDDLIVLHTRWAFVFLFLVRKIPFAGVELTSQCVRGLRGTSELPGRQAIECKKQNKKILCGLPPSCVTPVGSSIYYTERCNLTSRINGMTKTDGEQRRLYLYS